MILPSFLARRLRGRRNAFKRGVSSVGLGVANVTDVSGRTVSLLPPPDSVESSSSNPSSGAPSPSTYLPNGHQMYHASPRIVVP